MKNLVKLILLLMSIPVLIHFSYLFDKAVYHAKAPKITPFDYQQKERSKENLLLLPLDSRPPCLDFVKKLGALGNVNVISPPENILDNYTTPAPVAKINEWLLANIKNADAAIISIDMLRHGGLIASRAPQANSELEEKLFHDLATLRRMNSSDVYAFSIIPRLLIPENDTTKLWQYHVMVYATKKDMESYFQNPKDFERMQEMLDRVPPELIEQFSLLYEQNDQFNNKLLTLAQNNAFTGLLFGQDDGQPFGRPNESIYKVRKTINHDNLDTTLAIHGADELAMAQLTDHISKKNNFKAKIFVCYSTDKTSDIVMPFTPATLTETVQEKIASTGAIEVKSKANADIILYVHAGTKSTSSGELKKAAAEIHALSKEKPVALVDLSANFRQRETVLGTFLEENIPLSCLTAYAGWNTAGNSIGTALAQSIIFLISKNNSPQAEWLPLYQKNFEFTIARILDDWAYQKNVQDINDDLLRWKNINPYRLGAEREKTKEKIAYGLFRRQESIFYRNLGRYPFYSDRGKDYYLTKIDVNVKLPWERTFEVNIDVASTIGYVAK